MMPAATITPSAMSATVKPAMMRAAGSSATVMI